MKDPVDSGVRVVPVGSPDLAGILRAQMQMERLRSIRHLLLTILAFDGILIWLVAIRPRLSHTDWGVLALFLWIACFVSYALVGALELRAAAMVSRLPVADPQPDHAGLLARPE